MQTPASPPTRNPVHPLIPTLFLLLASFLLSAFATGFALATDLHLKDSFGTLYKPFNPFDVMTTVMNGTWTFLLAFIGYGLLEIARAIRGSKV